MNTNVVRKLLFSRGICMRLMSRMSASEQSGPVDKADTLTEQMTNRFFDCAATGKVKEVESLLGGSAVYKDARSERGWTALMFAARNGQLPVIQALVERGCDVNLMNGSGQTALDIATFWNHQGCATFLQQHCTRSPYDQAVNYYSQNPLYRASELRKDQVWLDTAIKKEGTKFVIFSSQLKPLLTRGQGKKMTLVTVAYEEMSGWLEKDLQGLRQHHAVFLGLEAWDPQSAAWFAVRLPPGEEEEEAGYKERHPGSYFAEQFPGGRELMMLEETQAGIFAEANSVLQWLDRYRFCPTCGTSTRIVEGGYKRVCENKECRSLQGVHNTCYPRVDPSLIMLVVSPDNKCCLLGRAARFPPKMYSCLAGFMEPGECIEDTCRREVQEESGVKVGRVEYHSSQPWPFPATLMLGCIAHARTSDIQMDPEELEDVRWFSKQELLQMLASQHPDGLFVPPPTAIATQLIMSWVKPANL